MKRSNKNTTVSLTRIRNLLKEAVFNPRTPGPMKIVAEQGSPEYYELRAIEEIHAARHIRQNMPTDSDAEFDETRPGFEHNDNDDYHRHMIKSIQLLLLARCYGTTET